MTKLCCFYQDNHDFSAFEHHEEPRNVAIGNALQLEAARRHVSPVPL